MSLYNEQDITVHIRGTMGDGFLNESKYIAYSKTYNTTTKAFTTTDSVNNADSNRNSVSIDKLFGRITDSTLNGVLGSNEVNNHILTWDKSSECIKASDYYVSTSVNNNSNQIPTSSAVYTAINNGFNTNNACLFRGTYTPASTSNATTLGGTWNNSSGPVSGKSQGYMWIVASGGYFYDIIVEAGDLIICGIDTPVDKSSYYVIQKNIDPSTYVTLAGAQTITGTKTFADVIVNGSLNVSGNIVGSLTGNATSATKLYSSAQVGSASLPVYFNQGVPVACTASSIFSSLTCSATNAISATIAGQTRSISITNFVTDALATAIEAKMPFGSYVPLAGTSTSEGKYINGSLHFAAATGERALCFNCRGVTRYLIKAQDGSADWVDTYGFKIGYKSAVTNKPFVVEMGNNGTPIEALSIGQDGEFIITSEKAPKYKTNTILHTGIASVNSGTRTITINGTSTQWVNNYVTGATFVNATNNDNKQIVRLTLTRGGHSTLTDLTADISQFTGATSSAAGTAGLVPQPAANNQNKYLKADGTWSAITTNQVYQSPAANDHWRPLILGYPTAGTKEADFSASTSQVHFDQQLRFNPSTNELYLDGSITTGNITATSLAVGNVTASGNVVANTFNGRSILDNTANTAITASTSIITANTLYYALPKINNSKAYKGDSEIYAPTTAGANSYILQSNGAGNAPSWITAATVVNRGLKLTTKESITVSLKSSVWTEVDGGMPITSNEPETYVIQILDVTTGVVHSGVFSTGNGNESDLEEIYLQVFSNSSSNRRLYAAIQNKKLQLASDDASNTNHTVTIKYRKLI